MKHRAFAALCWGSLQFVTYFSSTSDFLQNRYIFNNGECMARLEWQDDLDTGIDIIDQQHRRILEYINALDDLGPQHPFRPSPGAGQIINELVDYTMSHFGFEETLMEGAGYEFLNPHKKVHQLFTQRVGELQNRFKSGENVTAELHGLLHGWLFNHIRRDDANYVESVKAMLERKNQNKQEEGWLVSRLGRFFKRK
jgi:hemerythrin